KVIFDKSVSDEIALIRKLYNEEGRERLIQEVGKSPVEINGLLEVVEKLDVRAKAICLVNLVTANRPNEMVNLKIQDFDFDANFVSVYLRKQKVWHNKRLKQETVIAIKQYIDKFKLQSDDYFVGSCLKNGKYVSRKVSETAYRKQLKKWTGLTPYNFRKTQVAQMHSAGADLSTIAKQTGHRSLQTLDEHYLDVTDTTVDKYL